ncbi:MAG TPA: PP2C family protein-serine/threonine phosphatase [Acidobacteriota bacterium]|mgnify:CR=1 FL=1|nr:PP2C family protein-serine/threonine phosphatase [Acidobacteriota bacterium]HQM61869.1 PP2C family protein-serine/threonine phosphatase [Acidobacteriota bacterium]
MCPPPKLPPEAIQALFDEMENFQDLAAQLKPLPGEVPALEGIDIHGEVIPCSGPIGGDHIIYIDFKKRFDLAARIRRAQAARRWRVARRLEENYRQAGILLADVAGHRITDALLTAMLHQAFLLGVQYELEISGTITVRLFEYINKRFYQSSAVGKFLTMIYGEINEQGRFRFISAAHPPPKIFSFEFDRFVEISEDRLISFPPIGTVPLRDDVDVRRHSSLLGHKDQYTVNEISLLGHQDILLLYSDGLADHENAAGEPYFPAHLEARLREVKHGTALEIGTALREHLLAFGQPADDVSFIVIKCQ